MDAPEPETTAFDAMSAQTNRVMRVRSSYHRSFLLQRTELTPVAEIPGLPRRLDALRPPPLGLHHPPTDRLLPAHRLRPGLVHRRLLPGHLPAEPLPRLPATQVRPFTHTGRGARRRWKRRWR